MERDKEERMARKERVCGRGGKSRRKWRHRCVNKNERSVAETIIVLN